MQGKVVDLYFEIGKAIHRRRTAVSPSVSQQRLADAVGLSRASIVNIERGRHRIQIHVLYDIALALGVEVYALLPSTDATELADGLPSDFRRELNPNELAAVGRLLRPRGTNDAKS